MAHVAQVLAARPIKPWVGPDCIIEYAGIELDDHDVTALGRGYRVLLDEDQTYPGTGKRGLGMGWTSRNGYLFSHIIRCHGTDYLARL